MNNYIVATIKDWNIDQYQKRFGSYSGNWFLIESPEELTLNKLREIKPKYIFFPHWSWIVPESILDEFNCVCFHMTDVPYGRGGSPLQNLIIRGHENTKLTALRMCNELDAGPVYLKEDLSLAGSATDIFKRSASLTFDMIEYIVQNNPKPVEQQGEVTQFPRRKPEQSELKPDMDIDELYNMVRMLDAETYPKAFIKFGEYKLEFSSVENSEGHLEANVKIFKEEN